MKSKKSLFQKYLEINVLIKITVAIVLGIVAGIGIIASGVENTTLINVIKPLGDILIRLLKMIVVPVISLSLILGASNLAISKLGSVGIKILAIYFITNAAAVALGLIFANVFKPGVGLELATGIQQIAMKNNSQSIGDIFLNIIPDNILKSLVQGDILPIIFFSFIFGISLSALKEKGIKSVDFLIGALEGALETIYLIVAGVMQYAPFGVFALIFIVFATHGQEALGPLFYVILICYGAYIVQLIFVFGAMLLSSGLNVVVFFKKATKALITAFVTRTSSGTLPVSMQSMEDLGVNRSISSFTLPLGATINMNGTAIYLGICAMFVGFATNTPLTIEQQIITIITASLAAIGTAGVPGAGAIMLLLVFDTIGLSMSEGSPVALAYAMILGIDTILDMGRTALNVGGDMVCTAIIAKSENELDTNQWN